MITDPVERLQRLDSLVLKELLVASLGRQRAGCETSGNWYSPHDLGEPEGRETVNASPRASAASASGVSSSRAISPVGSLDLFVSVPSTA